MVSELLSESKNDDSSCDGKDVDTAFEWKERDEIVLKLLPELKQELGEELASGVSDASLCKFLYWKQDINRASGRFRSFVEWRKANPFAYDDVDMPLKISADPMLEKMLASDIVIAPESLVDREGNTVIVFRLRNNDRSDGRTAENICRMVLYTMDRVLERPHTQQNGVVIFHDMTGLSRSNFDTRVAKILPKALFGHLPMHIKGMYILNAPTFFKILFTVISKVAFTSKIRDRVHFISSLDEIYDVVDRDLLLTEHGGKLDFDSQQWTQEQKQREQQQREGNNKIESLTDCIPTTQF